ncbi:hypothetical protein [Neptuniibacter sp. QD37_11]|uniref:hypothetical protein n=1 Tax=Neptuniibacter sp. QD37_11 TaxID=3398209 RepID=UPI0039F57BEA
MADIQWNNVNTFLEFSDCKVIKDVREDESDENEKAIYTTKEIEVEGDTYRLEVKDILDCEGRWYEEKWFKNGEFHRLGDLPAHTDIRDHGIPTEAYLDQYTESYYLEGKLQKTIEKGLELLSQKPPEVLAYFGIDVDDINKAECDREPNPVIVYNDDNPCPF